MGLASGGVNAVSQDSSDHLLESGPRRTVGRRARAWSAAGAVSALVASLTFCSTAAATPQDPTARGYTTAALSSDLAATVLTLEPGVVGIQNIYHFTPKTLQGSVCAAPNTCKAVDYLTLPGDNYNEKGADKLLDAVKSLPADGSPAILMGYSQGAQVIYSALRRWQANPATAPDPGRVSWVSIGNPDNPVGGVRNSFGNAQPRPAETPYAGTEVIRQYDGWADWPDDSSNLLAVFNAVVGMTTVHSNYFDVNINDPANVRYTPDLADGSPGNVTYVWVPNPVLPMVAGFGPLAPTLDSWLRPTVEAAYRRPVEIPSPGAQAAATKPVVRSASSTVNPQPTTPKALGDKVSLATRSEKAAPARPRAAASTRGTAGHRSRQDSASARH